MFVLMISKTTYHINHYYFQDNDMVVGSMEFTDDKFRKFMNGHNDPADPVVGMIWRII